MNTGDAFQAWASDAARTNEELYVVELLCEACDSTWRRKHGLEIEWKWDEWRARDRERVENPAYRAHPSAEAIARTADVLAEITSFSPGYSDIRTIRDISALRFLPALVELRLPQCEADLAPLAELRTLKNLTIAEPGRDGGFVIASLAPLAGLPALEILSVNLRLPWPDLRALAEMPALRTLDFTGNLIALRGVGPLAAATGVTLKHGGYATPAEDFHALPALPVVEFLKIDPIASLAGIERVGSVVNLELVGCMRDLGPLARLERLTEVKLEGEIFRDVLPLARAPRLREITFRREIPFDLAPLAEAPALREVQVERCDILRTELSALNATLLPWGEDFLAPEPRPLLAPRLVSFKPQDPELQAARARWKEREPADPRAAAYPGDPAIRSAENRWFSALAQRELDALLGRGWGLLDRLYDSGVGYLTMHIKRYEDYLRLSEIIACLHALLATTRFRWRVWMIIEPHGDMSDDLVRLRQLDAHAQGEERPWLDDVPGEDRRDHDYWRQQRRARFARLQREHRARTLEQLGETVDPAEFSPGPKKPPGPTATPAVPAGAAGGEAGEDEFEDDEFEDDADAFDNGEDDPEDAGEGGVAEPPPAPPGLRSLGEKLHFQLHVTEGLLSVVEHMRADAEMALDVTFTPWNELPGPPESRPDPSF